MHGKLAVTPVLSKVEMYVWLSVLSVLSVRIRAYPCVSVLSVLSVLSVGSVGMFANNKTGGVVSVLLQSLTDNQLGFSWETLVRFAGKILTVHCVSRNACEINLGSEANVVRSLSGRGVSLKPSQNNSARARERESTRISNSRHTAAHR